MLPSLGFFFSFPSLALKKNEGKGKKMRKKERKKKLGKRKKKPFQSFHISARLDCPFPNIDEFGAWSPFLWRFVSFCFVLLILFCPPRTIKKDRLRNKNL